MALREGIYPYAALCRVRWLLHIRSRAGRDGVRMIHTCEVCHVGFIDRSKNHAARYCGRECRLKAKRAQARAYHEENRDEQNRRNLERYHAKRQTGQVHSEVNNNWLVIEDPDPEIGLTPGARMSGLEVKYARHLGTLTPGTVLENVTEGIRYQVCGSVDCHQELVRLEA